MADRTDGLEDAFGAESDDAFGSAVFRRDLPPGDDLEALAREVYRDFTGELWDRFGAAAWLGTWSRVASRDGPDRTPVLHILTALTEPEVRSAADMLTAGHPDPDAAGRALAAAFDAPGVSELKLYRIGDGGAMSGVLIAAREDARNAAVFLVFLMD